MYDKPTIEEHDEHHDIVRTPYSEAFVKELKETLPAEDRKWDGFERGWIINKHHRGVVTDIVLNHFDEVETDG